MLSLHQNIGGPCEQLVMPRQAVAWGELIGKGKIFVSATLHASVPGVIQRPARVTLANGRHMDTVPIKTDGEIPTGQALWDDIFGGEWPTTGLDAFDPGRGQAGGSPGRPALGCGRGHQQRGHRAAVARAVIRKKPLTHRVISVTGGGIVRPANVLAPIGISFGELIDFCGGLKSDAARLVAGGPMMGFAFSNPNTPVTKGTSGLTVMSADEVKLAEETTCVRCGKCVDVCPMRLVPTKITMASRFQDIGLSRRYNIMACFECGSCAYTCPAHIPLVQLIRAGKAHVAAADRE